MFAKKKKSGNCFVTRVEEQNLSEGCTKVGGNLRALFQPSDYIYRLTIHTAHTNPAPREVTESPGRALAPSPFIPAPSPSLIPAPSPLTLRHQRALPKAAPRRGRHRPGRRRCRGCPGAA